ncbi:MAG: lipase family alpha/beta hydrolase [Candidatus Nanopelagicales bacterium]
MGETHAVVIVSGGAAVSPYTTPTEACRNGLAAGNTDTALREALIKAGHQVFTSPARIGEGQVFSDDGWGGFSHGPEPLPAEMTVNSVGDIDLAGASLLKFLDYLQRELGVETVNLVGHSMGGLFSRSAIRQAREQDSSLMFRSLTTVGTPWTGAFSADFARGEVPLAECKGDPVCEASMRKFAEVTHQSSQGAGEEVTDAYLGGVRGWNARQGDALAGIPVVLLGGDYFSQSGNDDVWPNDGLVSRKSALGLDVSHEVLPHRASRTFPDVHSIYFTHLLDLPLERGLTWDPDVLAAVTFAVENPGRVT